MALGSLVVKWDNVGSVSSSSKLKDERTEAYIHGYYPLSGINICNPWKQRGLQDFGGSKEIWFLQCEPSCVWLHYCHFKLFGLAEMYRKATSLGGPWHTTLQYGFVFVDFLLHLLSHRSSMIVGIYVSHLGIECMNLFLNSFLCKPVATRRTTLDTFDVYWH